jgi:arabinan endo-1,5-alpha-L-arabinosidase
LRANKTFGGPGHNAIVHTPAGNDYIVYHAYYTINGWVYRGQPRVLMVDKITWANDWPKINDGTPSTTAQPMPR